MSLDPAALGSLRLALAGILLVAFAHKARDPAAFGRAVRDYALLPAWATAPGAFALAGAELVLAAALLAPSLAAMAACGAAALFALYAGAIASALRLGRRHIDCGCGGPAGRRRVGVDLVLRNAVLVLAALLATLEPAGRALVAIDVVTIGAGGVALALLYAAADAALANVDASRALRGVS